MQTVSYLHRYTAERHVQAVWGDVSLSDVDKLRLVEAVGTERSAGFERRDFGRFVQLAATEFGGGGQGSPTYPTDDDLVLELPVRAMSALSGVAVARVYALEPEGTTVSIRPTTSDGPYVWDGAAWTDAEEDWNTPDEVEAHLSAWPHKELGFEVALQTTAASHTPRFYGVLVGCSFGFGRSSIDASRPSSSRDDLLTRVLSRVLSEGPDYEAVEEFVTTEETDTISYADDNTQMDRTWDVAAIAAVYDLTADPGMTTPLDGSWDEDAKVFTLDESVAAEHTLHSRLRLRVPCAYSGDSDWFEQTLPYLHLTPESFTERELRAAQQLVHPDGDQVWVSPGAREVDAAFRLRVVSEDAAEAQEIQSALVQWLERGKGRGGYGRTVLSEATALPAFIQSMGESSALERRGDAHEVSLRLVVRRWAELHPAGTEPALQTVEAR